MKQFLVFVIIGTICFLVDTGIFYFGITVLQFSYAKSRLLSLVIAIFFSWVLNRYCTFQTKKKITTTEVGKFYILAIIAGVINYTIFNLLIENYNFLYSFPLLAIILATSISLAVNFFGMKLYLYKNDKELTNTICPSCKVNMHKYFQYIVKCPECNLYKSNLKPGLGRGVEGLKTLRKKNFVAILQHLKKTGANDIQLLEVGSGDGWFLDVCKDKGIECTGIEPYPTKDLLKRHPQVHQFSFPLTSNSLLDKQYDGIIFNDVLEYIEDIEEALNCCKSLLKKNGLLIVNIPSSTGFFYCLANILAKFGCVGSLDRLWQKGFASPHIWYFNNANLSKFISKQLEGELILCSNLQTMTLAGLWDRFCKKGNIITSVAKYCILLGMHTTSVFFSKDIVLHIYRVNKKS